MNRTPLSDEPPPGPLPSAPARTASTRRKPQQSLISHASPGALAADLARFRFLLGATDGEGVFTPDEE